MTDFETAINDLKTYIDVRFSELEKRFDEKFKNIIDTKELENKKVEYQIEIINQNIAAHNRRLEVLEKKDAENWKTVVASFLRWLVPFLAMAGLYFITHGGLK
jgi:pantothenate kinase